jgi:tRNA pseudouridine38-40 synthase
LEVVHGGSGVRISLAGAGRTDAGVHALGQVASYEPPTARRPGALLLALGGLLPEAIRVLDVWEAPPGFHARRSAIGKVYRYRIVNRRLILPFESPWSWWIQRPLDVGAMREAARGFVGRRDFAALVTAGGQSKTTVRTIRRLDVVETTSGVIDIEVEADGFLHRMVRNLTGFLAEVGAQRRRPEDVRNLLASRRRSEGGVTAPARGLCLVRVLYPAAFAPGRAAPEAPA